MAGKEREREGGGGQGEEERQGRTQKFFLAGAIMYKKDLGGSHVKNECSFQNI